jgi:hypothetical protein
LYCGALRAVRMDLSQGSLAYYATSQNGSSKSAAEGNHSTHLGPNGQPAVADHSLSSIISIKPMPMI